MMSVRNYLKQWEIRLALTLILASIILLIAHYLIFRDFHHIAIFTVHDIAFLPIEVLFVTLIIERMITGIEKREQRSKMKMLIGATFSELGNDLLRILSKAIPEDSRNILLSQKIDKAVSREKELKNLLKQLSDFKYQLKADRDLLEKLHKILTSKREFLVRLLENPVLLEDHSFSNALWATFHFSDELSARDNFENLPQADLEHLSSDINRMLSFIVIEWILYMKFLKEKYPYLYSLALRINPFDPSSSPVLAGNAT